MSRRNGETCTSKCRLAKVPLHKPDLYRAVGKGVSSRLGGAWPQLRENGFRSISWRARHDFTGFSCPSSQLVDLKPRFLSRRSMRSTYGHENPVKTFPLVPQLDLRANQSASEAAERPTWGCLRGRSPFIRPPGGQSRSDGGRMGARKRRQRDAVSFCVAPGGLEPTTHGL